MRHVDNCGSYENDIFCETGEFGKDFIKGLAKHLNETTKEAHRQLAIFTKMANWRKWGIGPESIKGLAKPQMRWQRGKSWQMAIIRKWQILVEQGKFWQKWRVCQKFMKGMAKYSNKVTKNQQYWQLAISRNWQIKKWGIGLESIKGLAKTQIKWQRGESWQMAIIIR